MKKELAETCALEMLGWLAGQDELFPVFLGATGAGEADVRARAGDADFLAAVVDFLLMDDAWVIACATAIGRRPEEIATIRLALQGGSLPHWT